MLDAGSVNSSAPAQSPRLPKHVCTFGTCELPSPAQLWAARSRGEHVPLAQPGTSQMWGSSSLSSYPQRFLNEFCCDRNQCQREERKIRSSRVLWQQQGHRDKQPLAKPEQCRRTNGMGQAGWHRGTGGSAPREKLGSRCPALHLAHPAFHLRGHAPDTGTHSWSGTAVRAEAAGTCLLLLDPFAEAPAWPLTTWGVSSHVAPKQFQLLMCVSEQQREQGARRDGLGQRCRTASTTQIPCST